MEKKSGNINMKQKDRLNELKRSKRDGQTNGMKERKIDKNERMREIRN